jgi:hypothetical protein
MGPRYIRHWWVFRESGERRTLLFPIYVEIDQDREDLYGATVAGLEDRIAGTGKDAAMAERAALQLFCDLIDYGEEKGQLEEFIGKVQLQRLPMSFDEVDDFISESQRILNSSPSAQRSTAVRLGSPWSKTPLSPEPQELCAASS